MKIMTAKYKGKCYACDVRIKVGDTIEWGAVVGSKHVDCAAAVGQQNEADKRKAGSITQLGDFTGVYALFEKAAKGGKWPRITINADGFEFYLYVSGQKAMIPGMINVKRNGDNGIFDWFGRITPDGAWDQRHKEVDERMADALSRLAMDPVGTAAMYGRLSGKCCFCKKQLTDAPSVDAGYGPVCAKRWGLAWGGKQYGKPYTESLNAFVQEQNAPYVLNGSEYEGPPQDTNALAGWDPGDTLKPSPGSDGYEESACEYCFGAKMIDGSVCMGCVLEKPMKCPKCYGDGLTENESGGLSPCMKCVGDWKAEDAKLSPQLPPISAQWNPDAPPVKTVTLQTKEIKFKVNLPEGYL